MKKFVVFMEPKCSLPCLRSQGDGHVIMVSIWVETPCGLVGRCLRFGGVNCFRSSGRRADFVTPKRW